MRRDISEKAYRKRLNAFFDKFKSDAAAGRRFELDRQYVGQMRTGIRPPNPKVLAAMGYIEVKVVPPVKRTYRKIGQ